MLEEIHILFSIGLVLTLGILAGRVANVCKLPRMMGYLIAGIVLGPSLIGVFSYERVHEEFTVLVDMALAIIAFAIGEHLCLRQLKGKWLRMCTITVIQILGAASFVMIALTVATPYLLPSDIMSGLPENAILAASLAIGAAAAATAPAAILSLVGEYKAKGPFTDTLLGAIAFDNVFAILLYGFIITISVSLIGSEGKSVSVIDPLINIASAGAIGVGLGVAMRILLPLYSEKAHIFPLILGSILVAAGLSRMMGFSPLLACMIMGFTIINIVPRRKNSKKGGAYDAFYVMQWITESIYGIFFLLAGAHIDLSLALQSIGFALIIFFARLIGKWLGCWGGAALMGSRPATRKNLGFAMLPAAGVMIGLTLDASETLGGVARGLMDVMVSAALGAVLFYELLAPLFVRYALKKSGDIDPEAKSSGAH